MRPSRLALSLIALALPAAAQAQRAPASTPAHAAYVDRAGVLRWRDTGAELALFGANYTLPSSSDYRAAGYLGLDRKRLVDDDLAHFARMGWDGMRLAIWGDWENTDSIGNLVPNEHLDLFDYALAKARERGISVLLSPIQTYEANWPDALNRPAPPGLSKHFRKGELGTNPAAIAAQVRYITQLLDHVNPYTHTAIKDEPAIAFIEMINEPTHHSDDLAGSVRYINALVDAVRATGCTKPTFHNVSQDFAIAPAIRDSKVDGATFGWYPTGLNSGHELRGSYLRSVDDYPPMRDATLVGRPRIVYEFDSADLRTGYMYPAMVRAFRGGGAQFASMFAYDMLGTASRNLGWQTHYLNLVYTPRKAISAVVAAEAMRRLPRGKQYGAFPANTRFDDFHVSAEDDLGELVAKDAFLYAGTTRSTPPDPAALRRVAGYGSSSVVTYDGEGVYFLDRVRDGVWRLEVYPDAVPVRDPYEMPSPDKIVTRAISRPWPMTVALPDLGRSFSVQPIAAGNGAASTAAGGRFTVTPGVYVLSARGPVARGSLPATIGHLAFDEFHAPPPDSSGVDVELLPTGARVAGAPIEIAARVASRTAPDSVTLWVRPAGGGWFRRYPMRSTHAYEYRATIPADSLGAGAHEYAVSVRCGSPSCGDSVTTFPERLRQEPWSWNFGGQHFWTLTVDAPRAPLALFVPGEDAARMSFSRIGDAGRTGRFRVAVDSLSGVPAFHFELPVTREGSPAAYTASLVVKDRVDARGETMSAATSLAVRARGAGVGTAVRVSLVERDGSAWSATVPLEAAWKETVIPLANLTPTRAALLPEGFPGEWNAQMPPTPSRGGAGDHVHPRDVERIQITLDRASGAASGVYGAEVESVTLRFR